jgi:two-component system, chemotaxis family, sensor kinase CheA
LVQREDVFCPIVRLYDFYDIETDIHEFDEGILIWLESDEKSFCLFVDRLIGEQQVVVKPLPAYLNDYDVKHYGISGCTIMGDGSISIILDPANMYDTAVSSEY